MFTKYYYLAFSIVLFIGSFRTFFYKKYEFRYYQDLDLGNLAYPISIIFLLIGIYLFRLFLKFNKAS